MNFYFCETCGKRVTDIDIQKGDGRDKKLKGVYCSSCAVGVNTMEMEAITDAEIQSSQSKSVHSHTTADMEAVSDPPRRIPTTTMRATKLSETKATTHTTAARVSGGKKPPSGSADRVKNNTPLLLGGAALIVMTLGVIVLLATGKSTAEKKTAAAPELKKTAEPAPAPANAVESPHELPASAPLTRATTPEAAPPASVTAQPVSVFQDQGEDIRDSLAAQKLSDIEQLKKDGKLSIEQLRAKYTELAESSYKTTKAGKQAAELLLKLPPQEKPASDVAQAPAPAAPEIPVLSGQPQPPPAGATTPPVKTAATAPATPATTGKSVWWEGESAIENNFIWHVWLAEQLDKNNLSGGKYLNHLNDLVWIKSQRKTPPTTLHAKWIVDVPADATYTLWVREYDPFCGVLWKFKWDETGTFFSVPANYPSENRVEVGKDRPLVWRNYPNQVLKKGKHTFIMEAPVEGAHTVAGFDCFYLTTDPFKPDGAKKP